MQPRRVTHSPALSGCQVRSGCSTPRRDWPDLRQAASRPDAGPARLSKVMQGHDGLGQVMPGQAMPAPGKERLGEGSPSPGLVNPCHVSGALQPSMRAGSGCVAAARQCTRDRSPAQPVPQPARCLQLAASAGEFRRGAAHIRYTAPRASCTAQAGPRGSVRPEPIARRDLPFAGYVDSLTSRRLTTRLCGERAEALGRISWACLDRFAPSLVSPDRSVDPAMAGQPSVLRPLTMHRQRTDLITCQHLGCSQTNI